jgi:hypothetical protein
VNTAEVVVREVQTVGRPKVVPLLTEAIRQAGEPAHPHSDGEVLTLHNRGADALGVRLSDN